VSLRHAVLGLLAQEPMSGYDLTKRFDRSLANVWSAAHSQIYPELARLKDEGLIRQVGMGPRGRKTYEITADGLSELRRWMVDTEPDRSPRDEAYLRVFFLWLLRPDDAARYLRRQAEHHRSTLQRYLDRADEPRPASPWGWAGRLALEAGIRHERALLEWAEWALGQVDARRRRRATGS
jgi:PadR family transcriptional regulator, regulatory protein AphA